MSFWNNSLFGFITKALTGTTNNNLGTLLNKADSETDLYGSVQSYFDKVTGRQLTSAEREANAFSEQQAVNAWNRDLAARSTAFQTQVQDMRAAGLNPMMAASGSGAAVPSSASPASVSPAGGSFNLGSLLSAVSGLAMMPKQKALIEAQIDKAHADAEKARADAGMTNTQKDFFESVAEVRVEAERLQNDMTRSQMRSVEQAINESKARENSALARAILDKANADNIVYMQPYIKAELQAKSDLERKQARVAVVDAAYRQHLLDSGAIEQSIRESGSKVTANEAIAELNRISGLIAKGDKHALASELGTLDKIDFWAKDIIGALSNVLKSIPVNFVVK